MKFLGLSSGGQGVLNVYSKSNQALDAVLNTTSGVQGTIKYIEETGDNK
ncbi:hypothetical protein [Fulvivirga sediminis]|uniref:Uncharacterized protein n=1 Tax=Fulvivirga sediminis TaxID=2803949 RepID=A0A937F5B7_9BACT|nr:hypothetical protein [Fulvivirga sediminis]MBL3656661.1 hypothetical protein [Fulvivirga sediminis]